MQVFSWFEMVFCDLIVLGLGENLVFLFSKILIWSRYSDLKHEFSPQMVA